MVQRLAVLADSATAIRDPFLNRERTAFFSSMLPDRQDPAWPDAAFRLAKEYLLSGEAEKAAALFEEVRAWSQNTERQVNDDFRRTLISMLATAYLRIGELENCVAGHNPDSCLFPIRGEGQHRQARGSREAAKWYAELLRENPEDLETRWLYNLAMMALGEYPDQVPPEWLIPPEAFASEFDMPRFHDVAPSLGLDVTGLAGGCVLDDFDGDGTLDLMTSSWGLRDQIRLFLNPSGNGFREVTKDAGLTGLTGGLNLVQADYDNDGRTDVLVLRGAWRGPQGRHPNSLLRNRGGGMFDDVTEEAGLLSFHPTQTAAWCDFNNDGWLDLFVGNESADGLEHPCELFQSNGDGTFVSVTEEAGLTMTGFVKGVAWGDYDDDGFADLYVSRLFAPNRLFRNLGPDESGQWRFEDATAKAGVGGPIHGFATWFWDFDNDGLPDLYASGYEGTYLDIRASHVAADYLGIPTDKAKPRLYRNLGDGSFADVTGEMGLDRVLLTMAANYGDLDQDGFLDIYLGTGAPDFRALMPNRMFRNGNGQGFQDVTTAGGFGHLQKGHGIAFGDLDNDGDQDIYAVMGGAFSGDAYPNALFRNPGFGRHWIALKLEGEKANRCAIGAKIRILASGPDGIREIYRTVSSGGSFGASPLRCEIGLGSATQIDRLEIRWPGSAGTQVFERLAVDRFLTIREGSNRIQDLGLKPLALSRRVGAGYNAPSSEGHPNHRSRD